MELLGQGEILSFVGDQKTFTGGEPGTRQAGAWLDQLPLRVVVCVNEAYL
jgi:hypothetical protein